MSDGPKSAELIRSEGLRRGGRQTVLEDSSSSKHRHDSFIEALRGQNQRAQQVVVDTRPFQPQILTVNEKLAEKNKGKISGVVRLKEDDSAKRDTVGKIKTVIATALASVVAPGLFFGKPKIDTSLNEGVAGEEVKGGTFADPLQSSVVETPPPAPETQKQEKLIPKEEILRSAFRFTSADELKPVVISTFDKLGKKIAPKELEKLREFEPSAIAVAKEFGLPEGVAQLMLGMVIQESQADRMAGLGENYKGPVAIGNEMTKRYGGKISNDGSDSRHNIDFSMRVLAQEIKRAYETWGDYGMAVWEWHAGVGNLIRFAKMRLGDKNNGENLKKQLEENKIDAFGILNDNNKAVYNYLASDHEAWNWSEDYLYLATSAAIANRDYKQQTPTISPVSQKP